MSLLNLVIRAVGAETLFRFNGHCGSPQKSQEALIRNIVKLNRNSEIGQKYDFGSIRSLDDFRKKVPIHSYADLSPYIEAALNGKPAQLTDQTPILFATTSGTTGKSKFIPVTPESKKIKSRLTRTWIAGIHRDHPDIFSGKILSVVSPEVEEYAPCGTPCGAESGQGYRDMPKALKKSYSQPYEVYTINDYDSKYYTLLRIAAGQQISFMVACNPSTVLLMAQRLGENGESIIRDVRDGTLSTDITITDEIRSVVEAQLKPDPERARFLEKAAAENGGVLIPRHVWPELKLIGCWKGGSVSLYLERFDQYFRKHLPVRDMGWLASEVRGSIPLSDEGDDGPLAIDTNVYEFYPADREGSPGNDDLLTVDQLEEGKRYYVYVTTFAGLYRYDMNDILEVTGFYKNTPMIRFVQKGKGVISFTGEKLYEEQVNTAVREAMADNNYQGKYEFITALGEMKGDKPRYVFLIEFDELIEQDEAHKLIGAIEQAVRTQNMEYDSKRKSHRIDTPAMRVIRPGEFADFRRRQVSGGKMDGQFKRMRLTKDVAFANEFEAVFEVEL
ncbi:MAG: GH3 auxin-responsive promoter family protein [Thermodesulfobacteriota bacterium]